MTVPQDCSKTHPLAPGQGCGWPQAVPKTLPTVVCKSPLSTCSAHHLFAPAKSRGWPWYLMKNAFLKCQGCLIFRVMVQDITIMCLYTLNHEPLLVLLVLPGQLRPLTGQKSSAVWGATSWLGLRTNLRLWFRRSRAAHGRGRWPLHVAIQISNSYNNLKCLHGQLMRTH